MSVTVFNLLLSDKGFIEGTSLLPQRPPVRCSLPFWTCLKRGLPAKWGEAFVLSMGGKNKHKRRVKTCQVFGPIWGILVLRTSRRGRCCKKLGGSELPLAIASWLCNPHHQQHSFKKLVIRAKWYHTFLSPYQSCGSRLRIHHSKHVQENCTMFLGKPLGSPWILQGKSLLIRFCTQVGLVIGLGALSLALLSVFGGDLLTKAHGL